MLHINSLTYRIEGRLLFDNASAGIAAGHKVGVVGRNGTGKTTLINLIAGRVAPDEGEIRTPRNARIGGVAQEAPSGPESLIDTVLAADKERASLLAEAETATDPHRIAEIQLRLSDIDAHSAPARAAAILAGLGFDETAQHRSCESYSGGWRMRVALASVLFTAPDILLLDEPSNYLDLEGTLWLENFLRSYPHTVLIVSHDRDLLNKAVTSILHLSQRKLTLYAGGYDQFEETRREQQRLQLKLRKKQDDARRHMEAFVERFRAKATKARQAQSRLKALQRMKPIAAQIDERVPPFLFPSPQKRLGNPLIRMEDVAVGYAPGEPVLRDLNLRIDTDDRIGLLGANGNGKSTFAKLLFGKLDPSAGHKRSSKKIAIGYFAQHQLDELNPQASAYDHIAKLMSDATEAQKRSKLGQIGFGVEKADTVSANLSGGEKARLLFALAAFHGPHLLILDEPTNHLDVDSREALIHALNEYEGAVILISHDRHLIEACADRLWLVENSTVAPYDGDISQYRSACLSQRTERTTLKGTRTNDRPASNGRRHDPAVEQANNRHVSRQEQRRLAAERRAQLAPLKRVVKDKEKHIAALTTQIASLDETLADSELYTSDPERLAALAKQRGQLARELADTEDAWLDASAKYESALERA